MPAAGFDVTVRSPDAFRVAADLTGQGLRAQIRSAAVVRHYGGVLHGRVRANATREFRGTGRYPRSIYLRVGTYGTTTTAVVDSSRPGQADGLEFGGSGVDRRGRRYNRRLRPHFKPALDRTWPEFLAAVAAAAVT